jgi:thiamine kinase-like enzyme
MIPENKLNDVKRALQSTFKVSDYDEIKRLTTGLSNAHVFRMVVQGKPYLLKIARTDFLNDPTLYYYSCMKPAADAGIAPKVWYAGVEDGISITDYIELKPFPLSEAKIKLADVLRKLHSLPAFTKTIHSLDTVNRFGKRFVEARLLPQDFTKDVFDSLDRINAVYPRGKEDLVPSHNDLKPENILYDGTRAWLSDWEAAFNNDRYSDLSIVANFLVANDADETEFLNRYFGRSVAEYERARFFLMRQIMHISYFTVFMVLVASRGEKIDLNSIEKHDFRYYHDRMWEGKIDLGPNEPRLEYALVHLEQLKSNLQTKRFEEALQIVSEANPDH